MSRTVRHRQATSSCVYCPPTIWCSNLYLRRATTTHGNRFSCPFALSNWHVDGPAATVQGEIVVVGGSGVALFVRPGGGVQGTLVNSPPRSLSGGVECASTPGVEGGG